MLLLLDGYDEYTPGTNKELDRAIERTLGKCLLILTSRPQDGTDFTRKIRNKMDGEVVIEGFSEENMVKCCCLFLGNQEKCEKFLKEAERKTGLRELLKVPILLLMVSASVEPSLLCMGSGRSRISQTGGKRQFPKRVGVGGGGVPIYYYLDENHMKTRKSSYVTAYHPQHNLSARGGGPNVLSRDVIPVLSGG